MTYTGMTDSLRSFILTRPASEQTRWEETFETLLSLYSATGAECLMWDALEAEYGFWAVNG